jgi:phosphoribosyl-dephospho-CoA transferase
MIGVDKSPFAAAAAAAAAAAITVWLRHQLVWPSADGWRQVLMPAAGVEPWSEQALSVLRHWAHHDLPLVVTRQAALPPANQVGHTTGVASIGAVDVLAGHSVDPRRSGRVDRPIVLGLPAPLRWDRQRLFIELAVAAVRRVGNFPPARDISRLLAPELQPAWRRLCGEFDALGSTVRVHGSFGWQQLSRLVYLHPNSDIDLHVQVDDATQADALVAALLAAPRALPRLDGELIFGDGAAVAWREWAQWRAGSVDSVLVKRLHGVALEDLGALAGRLAGKVVAAVPA